MANGHSVQLYQVGHRALFKGDTMYRKPTHDQVEVQLNGCKILIDNPIPGRPNVLRITTSDGRRAVLGDHGTFTERESIALRSAVEDTRTYWGHYLDEKERQSLANAEHDLASALTMVEESSAKLETSRTNLRRFTAQHDGHLDEHSNRRDIHRLERLVDAAHGEWLESRKLEGHARSALSNVS